MGESWSFEHSIETKLDRAAAWSYMTNPTHWAEHEAGVDRIELEGPFVSGTRGRTIGPNYEQEWELRDVLPDERFSIVGEGPGLTVTFTWMLADAGTGTRLTQRIAAEVSPEAEFADEWQAIQLNAPQAAAKLAAAMDSA